MVPIFRRLLDNYLLIKKGEEKKVFLFFVFFTILMAGQEIGNGVSASLFLTNVGIGKLPFMLLIAAAVNFFAVIFYMGQAAKRDNRSLFLIILWTGLMTLIPARIIFPLFPELISYVYYAAAAFLLAIINLHFSVYVADYFNVRQAKRLVPLIFTGSRIGGISGGIIMAFMTEIIGSGNIPVLWICSLAGAFVILIYIDRCFTPEVFDYEKRGKESSKFFRHLRSGFQFFRGSSLLKSLAAGTFLIGFLSLVMNYLYSHAFLEAFPDTDRLTAFFGIYIIISNVLGFVIQAFLANRIIDSLGLGLSNQIYAWTFMSGFAGLSFFGGLPAAVWGRFTDEQFQSAIQAPVESLMYNAIPDNERARARAFANGLITPLSQVFGSLSLQGMITFLNSANIALTGLVISILYILVAEWQNRGYVKGLMNMIREKTFTLGDLQNLRWEKPSKKELENLYSIATGGDSSIRESSVKLLLHLDEEIDFGILKQGFFNWLADSQAEFLCAYFKRVKKVDDELLLDALERCDPSVKTIVIEYFIENAIEPPARKIKEYLCADSDFELQNSAIRYFYLTGFDGKNQAFEIFKKRLRSEDPEIIRANLLMIKDLYDEKYIDYARGLLQHQDRLLAIDAVNTLAAIYQPRGRDEKEVGKLVDELIERNGYHNIKAAVMILGKQAGERQRERLIRLLNISSGRIRDIIIDTLIRNYPDSMEVYLEYLEVPVTSLEIRENLIFLIRRSGKSPDRERLKGILKRFIEEYFELAIEQEWLKGNNFRSSLLYEMCDRNRTHIRSMILHLLETLLHQKVVISIEKALLTKNPRLISCALELFENLWDKKQAKHLITLFYPENIEEEIKISRAFAGDRMINLEKLISKYLRPERTRWDICAALALVKDSGFCLPDSEILYFSNHDDPVVRETAASLAKNCSEDFSAPIDTDIPVKERIQPMLTTIEKVIFLKNAPLFKSLKMDELRMVAEISGERRYAPDELVIEKGDMGDTMFIIVSGEVEIYLPGNPEKKLAVLKETDFFGEMALFDEDVRSASVRALTTLRLLYLERTHFLNLIYEKPDISIEIVKVLSERLRKR